MLEYDPQTRMPSISKTYDRASASLQLCISTSKTMQDSISTVMLLPAALSLEALGSLVEFVKMEEYDCMKLVSERDWSMQNLLLIFPQTKCTNTLDSLIAFS